MEGRSNIAPWLIAVVVLAFAAALLLLFAFVSVLSEIIGSLDLSLLITGTALGVAAWVTYRVKLHPVLEQFRLEYEEFTTIVAAVKKIYDCAMKRLLQLLALWK